MDISLLRSIFFAAVVIGSFILPGGCNNQHPTDQSTRPAGPVSAPTVDAEVPTEDPGPTALSSVAEGYQLQNHQFRVVISGSTGDVVFWGSASTGRNALASPRGIYATLTGMNDTLLKGSVRTRDGRTCQFIGEDEENHLTLRKSYDLKGDVLLVRITIANKGEKPLDTAIQLNGQLPDFPTVLQHNPELFEAVGNGTISLTGYNSVHAPTSRPVLPTLLQSDTFHLLASERQSYTSLWVLSP